MALEVFIAIGFALNRLSAFYRALLVML